MKRYDNLDKRLDKAMGYNKRINTECDVYLSQPSLKKTFREINLLRKKSVLEKPRKSFKIRGLKPQLSFNLKPKRNFNKKPSSKLSFQDFEKIINEISVNSYLDINNK